MKSSTWMRIWLFLFLAAIIGLAAVIYAGSQAGPPQQAVEQQLDAKQFGF